MRKIYSFFVAFFLLASVAIGQITTNGTMTPQQLVQNVLLGSGVTATNITYTGYANSISEFSATPLTNLGFNGGVYLTSGSYLANDPNGFGGGADGPFGPRSNHQSVDNGTSGDPDLDNVSGYTTYDAAVLEFDFIPQSDTVKFRYIFGSEEYNDFVGGGVNDAFAFILSGVTTALAPTNIALIPGTAVPVSINTVNNGNAGGISSGPCSNCAYYRDNWNSSIDCAYDGLLVVLTAKHAVTCGETYHIKIAIADAGDHIYDSGVFLEAGSFSSSAPFQISTSGNSIGPIGSSNTLYENCGALNLLFTRPATATTTTDTLTIQIDGTSSPADYTGLTNTIIFNVGVDTVVLPVTAIDDGFADAGETVHIFYTYTNPCNIVDTIDYTFTLLEAPPFTHTLSNDTTICSAASVVLSSTASGGVSPMLYNWSNTGGTTVSSGANYTAPAQNETYYYYVTDACRQDTIFDSVQVAVNTFLYITGTLDVIGSPNDTLMIEGCGSATLTFTENGAGAGVGTHQYPITISGSVDNTGGTDMGVVIQDTVTFVNQTTVTYNLSALTDANFEGDEYITIVIDYGGNPCIPVSGVVIKTLHIQDPDTLEVNLPADTTICKGRGVTLFAATTGGGGTMTYAWSPNTSLTTATAVVLPSVSTTYYVTATESCNGQSASDSVRITVLYNPPVVNSLDHDTICIGRNYEFNTVVTNGTGNLTGSWVTGYQGDLQSNGSANSWVIYNVQTSSTFIYSVKDECNVKDYDTLYLYAEDCSLVIPNILTINNDNVNEVFYIKNLEHHPETAVTIFDRWGKRVYESMNYDNKWNPKDAHAGVYFYVIEPKGRDKFSGYLHIFTK